MGCGMVHERSWVFGFFAFSSLPGIPARRPSDPNREAQDKHTGHVNGTTPLPVATKTTRLSSLRTTTERCLYLLRS